MILHDSEPLTMEQAQQAVREYPDHEVVYIHGDTIVWHERPVVFGHLNPFQLDGYLDTLGVPKPRIVLNMEETP